MLTPCSTTKSLCLRLSLQKPPPSCQQPLNNTKVSASHFAPYSTRIIPFPLCDSDINLCIKLHCYSPNICACSRKDRVQPKWILSCAPPQPILFNSRSTNHGNERPGIAEHFPFPARISAAATYARNRPASPFHYQATPWPCPAMQARPLQSIGTLCR